MSEPFSFGFNDADIECDDQESDILQKPKTSSTVPKESPPDAKPELHSLGHLLSFLPSKISYCVTEFGAIRLPHREVFDIRAQIMAEEEVPGAEYKYGLDNDDIVPKIYEGGFKTWECSRDLAGLMAKGHDPLRDALNTRLDSRDYKTHVVELGAGSALPSLALFSKHLSRSTKEHLPIHPAYYTLCDYNKLVLTHLTLPNFFLVWCDHIQLLSEEDADDLEITPGLVARFLTNLAERNIHICGISGGWGREFCELVPQVHGDTHTQAITLVLASETIYSLPTLQAFADTLTFIMLASHDYRDLQAPGDIGCAYVAAKKVYFGVGGGLDDFLETMHSKPVRYEIQWESEEGGVGRVILYINAGSTPTS